MFHPKRVGDRATLALMVALTEAGYTVYTPFGENSRTDLVIEQGEKLARVQCKSGRLRAGVVTFKVCSSYAHHPNPKTVKRDYLGEVDYFGIYCVETGGAYLVPIRDLQLRWQGALRVEPPRNNQRTGVRLAAEYEIGRVIVEGASGELRAPAGA
jgi:hypothetical protein